MTESINEPVSVALVYSAERRRPLPWIVEWRRQRWRVTEMGFHHFFKEGKRLIHVFEVVVDGHLQMRLRYDTESLGWMLLEVSDGNPD